MKKPNATTVIDYKNFRRIIFPLPVNNLMFVGKSTYNVLTKLGINTIGDLAHTDKYKLIKSLGKLGESIYNAANGIDNDEVKLYTEKYVPKSISKGRTFKEDTNNLEYMKQQIRELSDIIAMNLRKHNLKCTVVCINIKDNFFNVINRQKKVEKTDLFQEISRVAIELLKENYIQNRYVRAITVFANNLMDDKEISQLNMFDILENNKHKDDNNKDSEKILKITNTVDKLREKYGKDLVTYGSLKLSKKE